MCNSYEDLSRRIARIEVGLLRAKLDNLEKLNEEVKETTEPAVMCDLCKKVKPNASTLYYYAFEDAGKVTSKICKECKEFIA